jgi:hypothetical protein
MHGTGRLIKDARRDHAALYAGLRERHPGVFADRPSLRRAEGVPLWKRAVYPILFGRRGLVPFRLEFWLQRTMMKRGLRLR